MFCKLNITGSETLRTRFQNRGKAVTMNKIYEVTTEGFYV